MFLNYIYIQFYNAANDAVLVLLDNKIKHQIPDNSRQYLRKGSFEKPDSFILAWMLGFLLQLV